MAVQQNAAHMQQKIVPVHQNAVSVQQNTMPVQLLRAPSGSEVASEESLSSYTYQLHIIYIASSTYHLHTYVRAHLETIIVRLYFYLESIILCYWAPLDFSTPSRNDSVATAILYQINNFGYGGSPW